MIASGRGQVSIVEQLLAAGADIDIRAENNWNANDFATCQSQKAICDILESYKQTVEPVGTDAFNSVMDSDLNRDITEEQRAVLNVYHNTFSDEKVDYNLAKAVIQSIATDMAPMERRENKPKGSILVFLPGYDDIVSLKYELLDCLLSK